MNFRPRSFTPSFAGRLSLTIKWQFLLLQYLNVPSNIVERISCAVGEFQIESQSLPSKMFPTGTGSNDGQHKNVSPSGLMKAFSNGIWQKRPENRAGGSSAREKSGNGAPLACCLRWRSMQSRTWSVNRHTESISAARRA